MSGHFQKRLLAFATGVISIVLAVAARADSPLTETGLAAFSGGRYAEAAQDWQRAAESGDGQAALYVGLMYDLGRGVAADEQFARAWYERAAAMGNSVAMFNVGVFYDAGIGVPRDRALSVEWYRKAAAAGMGRAAYALGLIYEAGDGVSPDRNQAVLYFRQALARGVSAARARLVSLGALSGAAKRDDSAPESIKESGAAAFERAQELLLERTPQAKAEAAALLQRAAANGDLLAAYDLAYCYEHGIGLQVDRRQAALWYGRAARSPVVTVQRAAQAGLQAVAHNLSPSELAETRSAPTTSGPTQ